MSGMSLDAKGIKFMKDQEGIPKNAKGDAIAYQDERGIWTIGWGHTSGVKKGDVWPIAKAEATFKSDVNSKYGKCVNDFIKPKMTQNQFNAMTDFCYNIGVSNDPKFPGFPQSQVCKKFNKGDIKGASNSFMGWIKPISLIGRRKREIALFNTPDSGTKPVVTDNNKIATDKAKADAIAKTNAQIKLGDKLREQDIKDELAEKKAIEKAELSKDQVAINKAKAKAKANALLRKTASDLAKANKIKQDKANALKIKMAQASNDGINNSKSQPLDAREKTLPNKIFDISNLKVLKNGYSLLGLVSILLLLYNAELPTTELE